MRAWANISQYGFVCLSSLPWIAGRKRTASQWRCVAAPALLAVLAACAGPESGPTPGGRAEVLMPPDEFIHAYQGKVTVMPLPHKSGNPMLSLSSHAKGQCAVWLPRVGDPGITEALYECLAVIEIANCNGATDINTPAVRARSSFAEQARYGRPCSQGGWNWAFNLVREPRMTEQTASAALAASPF
jgi:hypothetical protein